MNEVSIHSGEGEKERESVIISRPDRKCNEGVGRMVHEEEERGSTFSDHMESKMRKRKDTKAS